MGHVVLEQRLLLRPLLVDYVVSTDGERTFFVCMVGDLLDGSGFAVITFRVGLPGEHPAAGGLNHARPVLAGGVGICVHPAQEDVTSV